MELGACVRALERRQNFVYQWNFVRGLKARMRRKALTHPGRFPVMRLAEVRTVRQFDEVFTAPHFGFDGAEDYYHRASAMRVIDRIGVPGADHHRRGRSVRADRARSAIRVSPATRHITLMGSRRTAAIADSSPTAARDDGYWAEQQVIGFAGEHAG